MLDIPLMSDNITRADKDAIIDFVNTSDRFTNGPKVRELEAAWSEWLGVKHSLFVNSGSSANFITMAVLRDLKGTGEIIVPPITWASDIASVLAAGFTPVFADVNLNNLAMREDAILSHITPETKGVFLTHVLGFNGLSESLLSTLVERGIPLVEDVCESHGATLAGRKCGTFGLAANFSFYYAHHMSTIEGGMICTNDDGFYQRCRIYRSHGMAREMDDLDMREKAIGKYPDLHPEFIFLAPGFNMRSTEINAVLGLNQLKRLDANNEKRIENFNIFLNNLDPDKFHTGFDRDGAVNYAFVIMPRNNEKYPAMLKILRRENVEYRRGTAGGGNMSRQPFVRRAMPQFDPASLKNADYIHFNGVYTGNYPGLEREKILGLCEALNSI